MFNKLSGLIKRLYTPKDTLVVESQLEKKLWGVLEDIFGTSHSVDWGLTKADHEVLQQYVAMFVRKQEVTVEDIIVSERLFPKLHRFAEALRGENTALRDTMAAYDYLVARWPELTPIIDRT